jgi:hypothetical protein
MEKQKYKVGFSCRLQQHSHYQRKEDPALGNGIEENPHYGNKSLNTKVKFKCYRTPEVQKNYEK